MFALIQSAASSSAEPPISPNMITAFGLGVGFEELEAVDEARAGNRVTTDADARRDADALLVQLVERLVRERAGAADDADRTTRLGDLGGDEADVALADREDAGTVRAEDARRRGSRARPSCRTRASSCIGMPSVTTTMSSSPASAASITAAPAAGAGTITIVAVAPVSFTASATDANTGMPSTSVPALLGVTPPTTFVPYVAVAQPVEPALASGQALARSPSCRR